MGDSDASNFNWILHRESLNLMLMLMLIMVAWLPGY